MSEQVATKPEEVEPTVEPVEPETPLTLEERIAQLEEAAKQNVVVINNLITYCNTIERWRKVEFLPEKPEESGDTDGDKPTEK